MCQRPTIRYPQMVLTEIGARGETRTHDTGFAVRRLGRLATRANLSRELTRIHADKRIGKITLPALFVIRVYLRSSAADLLERKERFESRQVGIWKTRMFPATSLPRFFGVRRLVGALDVGVRIRFRISQWDPKRRQVAALQNWNSWQDLNPQPRRTTTPARLPRWGPRFRSVALFHLSYRSERNFELRISKFGFWIT
jgi:hypothetical protein